ncbi:MAG: c-type cytochrome, partial [Endozoicomonas sp.]
SAQYPRGTSRELENSIGMTTSELTLPLSNVMTKAARRASILITCMMLLACSPGEKPEQRLPERLQAARNKAITLCAGCHGPQGQGTAPFNPNLACQKKVYMVRQLEYYRDGSRTTHPPMTHIARMLSEDEVDAISEWYSITGCR